MRQASGKLPEHVKGMLKGGGKERRGETLTWALIKTGATHHCAVANHALDPMLSSLCFFLLIFMTTHRGRSILTTLRKKMKLKEKKIFAQGYTESKWQNHKVNSDLSNAKKKKKSKAQKGKAGAMSPLGSPLALLLTQTHHGRCRSYSSQTTPSAFLPTASGDS